MEVRFAVINFLFYNLVDMKDFDAFLITMAVCVIAFFIFTGIITAVKKSFQIESPSRKIDAHELLREQKRRAQDAKDQYKRLMESQKQRTKDLSR